MLVEDNPTTQETLKRDLEGLGLEVVLAASAEEAWKLLENETKPDALVLDFHLPGEDGPSFFRRLNIDPRFSALSVIPFTALMEQQDGPSHSKVTDFVSARKSTADNIHTIVSKKGRGDIIKTPPDLILAICHALKQKDVTFPAEFRAEVKRCVETLLQKMDTVTDRPE